MSGAISAVGISAATAASIGTAASVIGAGVGAYGAIRSGEASSAAAKANAQIQNNNANVATQNANFAAAEGETNAAMKEMQTRAAVGQELTEQAANGVDVNSGSAVDTRTSTQQLGQLDAATIRSNAARQAYGYQTQSQNATSQAGLDTAEAGNDITAGDINAGSTILGGVGSASSKYSSYLQNGGKNLF